MTVNSVIAGPTHTGGVRDFVYQLVDEDLPWEEAQREFMRQHRPQSLLERLIEPEEIAHMVTYLSSPFASATTGGACGSTVGTSTRSCPERPSLGQPQCSRVLPITMRTPKKARPRHLAQHGLPAQARLVGAEVAERHQQADREVHRHRCRVRHVSPSSVGDT